MPLIIFGDGLKGKSEVKFKRIYKHLKKERKRRATITY
jgi:hypothetical protein